MIKNKISPYLILIGGFAGVILLGASLLLLPFSTYNGITVIDALFTSTSAVCVTGLVSVPSVAGVFTLFGQIIILLLIEIGGLGFVTLVIFLFSLLGVKIGISDRYLIKESLNQNSLKGMVKLVRYSVFITLIIQVFGTIINFIIFSQEFSFWSALWMSLFHAISAFNNAGFDLFGSQSIYAYKDNFLLNINMSLLIILGGIGFIVIYDVMKKRRWKTLSIHSKIVIKTSLLLIIFGTLLLKISEGNKITWLQAYFNSVSARTAGFSTVMFDAFTNTSLLVIIILMYIGASPASTGGGIKTTSFYTVVKYLGAFARGKEPITYNRQIARNSVVKAFILVVFSLIFISGAILLISFIENFNTNVNIEQHHYFSQIVFEVFSAFGTVGNSMGVTVNLHWLSKFILCLTMFFGRLGPITIISAWNKNWTTEASHNVKYLEEKMIIG